MQVQLSNPVPPRLSHRPLLQKYVYDAIQENKSAEEAYEAFKKADKTWVRGNAKRVDERSKRRRELAKLLATLPPEIIASIAAERLACYSDKRIEEIINRSSPKPQTVSE